MPVSLAAEVGEGLSWLAEQETARMSASVGSSGHRAALALSRYVPLPDLSRCSKLSKLLLDHLVGGHLHDQRHREAERLCGLEVDDPLRACLLVGEAANSGRPHQV